MKVSKFSEAVPFVFFSIFFPAALIVFHDSDVFLSPIPVVVLWGVCTAMSLFFLWTRAKYYVLTQEGIEHKIFGIRYRTTLWDDVQDVMRSKHPTQGNPNQMVLVFTKKGTQVLRQEAFLGTKAFWSQFLPGWLKGDRFVIRLTGMQEPERILQYVQAHHKLDFDDFQ